MELYYSLLGVFIGLSVIAMFLLLDALCAIMARPLIKRIVIKSTKDAYDMQDEAIKTARELQRKMYWINRNTTQSQGSP